MQYIVDFFKGLGETITPLIKFIIDFFTGLFDFFVQIPEYVEIIESYIELIPEPILPIALLALAAQLIFVIIGRRGV